MMRDRINNQSALLIVDCSLCVVYLAVDSARSQSLTTFLGWVYEEVSAWWS